MDWLHLIHKTEPIIIDGETQAFIGGFIVGLGFGMMIAGAIIHWSRNG